MKRFLIHMAIWMSFVFVVAIVLDVLISSGLRKTDIRKYSVWNDIYKGGINADLLVIGSSRAWCSYSTFILDSLLDCNSYNLGLDGHTFDAQLIRYNTYRRFNSKPSLVLVNTDFLSTLSNSADPRYEREQFFPYIRDSRLINSVAKDKHITWLERYLPLLRYFGYRDDIENGIEAFGGKRVFSDGGMHKGYRGNDYIWDQASLKNDTVRNVKIDWRIAAQLDSFVNDSFNEGVMTVFVKSPVYRPLLDHFTGIAQTDSIFDAIAEKHHIPVLDFYSSPIGLDSSFFYNPSHLNKKGSEVFTKELCKALLGILSENHLGNKANE